MLWLPLEGKPLDSILDSDGRYNIWDGPVRSGKTVHSLIRWLEFASQAPPGDLWMIGKTEDALERNILAPLKEFTGGAFDFSRGQHRAWIGDRQIYILGAANREAEGKIRGSTAAGIYGDELTLWPAELFKQCGLRMSVRGSQFFGTTNPDGPYHWLKTDYLDKLQINLRRFNWAITDNTTLDPEYIAALELEYVGLWYKRFILGLWVAAEGAIYDFWDEEIYTHSSNPIAQYYFASVDYGTSNATAAGLFGVNIDSKPSVWLEKEYYHSGRDTGKQKTDSEYADEIVAWLEGTPIRYMYVDPSAASFKLELRKRNIVVKDANNDVVNGIRFQAKMLKSGLYTIGKGCKQTMQDYGAYLWDSKAQARGEDKPLKINDHSKDMERYALFSEFGKEKPKIIVPDYTIIDHTGFAI